MQMHDLASYRPDGDLDTEFPQDRLRPRTRGDHHRTGRHRPAVDAPLCPVADEPERCGPGNGHRAGGGRRGRVAEEPKLCVPGKEHRAGGGRRRLEPRLHATSVDASDVLDVETLQVWRELGPCPSQGPAPESTHAPEVDTPLAEQLETRGELFQGGMVLLSRRDHDFADPRKPRIAMITVLQTIQQPAVEVDGRADECSPGVADLVTAQSDWSDDPSPRGRGLSECRGVHHRDAGAGPCASQGDARADDAPADHDDVVASTSHRQIGLHRCSPRRGMSLRALPARTSSSTAVGRSSPEMVHRPDPGGTSSEYGKYSSSVARNRR